MTAFEYQQPIHRVMCDHEECSAIFTPSDGFHRRDNHLARSSARKAGWDVPPVRGKGSRSQLDYCPEHKTDRASK